MSAQTITRDPHDWMMAADVAREYDIAPSTAARLLAEPDAPVVTFGRMRKARRGELEAWLRQRPARSFRRAS